jgi:hypothetical protein
MSSQSQASTIPLATSSAATDFIKLLFEPGDLLCFAFQNAETGKWTQAFRTYESSIQPETMKSIARANDAGHNVYVAMNTYRTPSRKEVDIASVRNVWAELDENGRENLDKIFASTIVPEPTVVNESSPNKFHAIWKVKDLSVEEAKSLLKSICAEFNGDKNAIDAARVLRLPGFKNCKYADQPEVEIVHLSENTAAHSGAEFALVPKKALVTPINAVSTASRSEEQKAILIGNIFAQGQTIQQGNRNSGLTSIAGALHNVGLSLSELEEQLSRYNDKFVEPPLDSSEIHTIAGSINKKPVVDPVTTLINGKLPGEAAATKAQTKEEMVRQALADQEQRQQNFDAFSAECDQALLVDPNPYPYNAWAGTPYEVFAELCSGRGTAYPNNVPPEFAISSLMTYVGAIAGHRVHPKFDSKLDGRFYTILLTPSGGGGKGSSTGWAEEVFAGTGLVARGSKGPCAFQNIGALVGDFGSARGLIKTFAFYPRILQVYEEVSTPFEKFGIQGSGTSFKDMLLNLYDSTTPPWSVIGDTKIPENAPTAVYNSLLGGTTTESGRWDEMFARSNDDTLRQRLNIIPSEDVVAVAILARPDFTEFRKEILPRIQMLNTYQLTWDYSTEARKMFDAWFEKNVAEARKGEDKAEKEAYGRMQVLIHRVVSHLALWLAPLPTKACDNGKLFEDEVGSSSDLVDENIVDKVWEVVVPVEWMERALQIAEHQIKARRDNTPPSGQGPIALCENLIKKHMSVLRRSRWFHLSRKASLDKFGYDYRTKALFNAEKQGLLTVEKNPSAPDKQKDWVVVWWGDGRHVKKWDETRGGSRPGSGRKSKTE